MEDRLITKDIYIIPSTIGYMIYSPLRRITFFVNEEEKNLICDALTKEEAYIDDNRLNAHIIKLSTPFFYPEAPKPDKMNRVTIILSQLCNMECAYCYAHDAHSEDVIPKEQLKIVLDKVLQSEQKRKGFSFVGGGEPTLTWDLFRWAVEYIRKEQKAEDIVNIGLTTNGTLLDCKKILFIKENRINVSLSFDILPDIQNSKRPLRGTSKKSFECVDDKLKKMLKLGIYPRIRATITDDNLERMPQMVQYVIDYYPQIKKIHFEQQAFDGPTRADYYDLFVDYFFKAKDIAEKNGIMLYNSIVLSLSVTRERYCEGEFCLTPSRNLVACHRISGTSEKFFERFRYGYVEDDIHINQKKRLQIHEMSDLKPDMCQSCFARWHCAGGCPQNRLILSDEQFSRYCNFVKKMLKRELERML